MKNINIKWLLLLGIGLILILPVVILKYQQNQTVKNAEKN